ncbi:hypothetical protein AB0M46_23625 [Dactylosporangium sp. NPDC051485]|uniref:hypothetical protein n=1 Tax=Dactylosporangium sp. NPDC051485 TaxID=3154846 RepID=UPI0034282E89
MTATVSEEAQSLATILSGADPELLVATWGGTARGEMTRLSDLDLFCWNPRRTPLPELMVRHAAYLDLVTCDDDRAGLHRWATSNATDLHAVMFARPLGPPTARSAAQFDEVVEALWADQALRAREVYHLVATSIAGGRLYGAGMYRPEKFAVGATRCWSALAECGQLILGIRHGAGTEAMLRSLAADGLLTPTAVTSFQQAMRFRLKCEEGEATFAELASAYNELEAHYLTCAGDLIRAGGPWLQRHAPLTPKTFARLGSALLAAPRWPALAAQSSPTGKAEAMMHAFLADNSAELRTLLGQPRHGSNWWVRHAAILNAHCDPRTLESIVDAVVRTGGWWANRNLILYAIRHPAADAQLLDRLRGMAQQLRPMDREALAAREQTTLRCTERSTH